MKAFLFFFFVLIATSVCVDLDGDGFDTDPAFGQYQDCCDSVLDGCFDPYMVNPGAYEIPNNGIADRCVYDCNPKSGLKCEFIDEDNLPCDLNHVNAEHFDLSGAQVTPAKTEPAIYAMDICEFKDDDDDPSWGFYRQRNMVFALANQKREGFDILVTGPDIVQASVISSFGRIGPYNGKYMTAISSGAAKSSFQPLPNNQGSSYGTSYVTVDDQVSVESDWTNNPGGAIYFPTGSGCTKPALVVDSILARFAVVQPTNMNAFSLKALYLDTQIGNNFLQNYCDNLGSFFLALKNGTHGVPGDRNIAIDSNGWAFGSYNPNRNYYTQCNDYRGTYPSNTCYDSDVRLEGTEYTFATNWIPFGTSALPQETFELQLITFDQTNGLLDATVLLDDFRVMSEARATHNDSRYFTDPWGYQYTGDIAMVSLLPDVNGIYPASTSTITLTFIIRNEGPQVAGDVTISFTPPFGTSLKSVSSPFTRTFIAPAADPFADNSFYKYKLTNNTPIQPHETLTGTITYNIKSDAPKDIQFRVTATTSSIDTVWGNNHLLQLVYIAK